MNNEVTYKNMSFGCKKYGQTVLFQIKYSSVEDDLFDRVKKFTYWQDCFVTKGTKLMYGKPVETNYWTIVGSYHISYHKRCKVLSKYFLNKRNFIKLSDEFEQSCREMDILDCVESFERNETKQQQQKKLDEMYSLDSL